MSALPGNRARSQATSLDRRIRMLRTAMGPEIAQALEDPDVVEIMLNPDGSLWIDRLSSGRAPMGVQLSAADGERIIRLVAAHVHTEVHRGKPLLTAELPETGERFEGALPPVAPGRPLRCASARSASSASITTSSTHSDGGSGRVPAPSGARTTEHLIAGGTSTGKTTLANALLAEIASTGDRVIILEDTVELQCAARDHVPLRTRAGVVSMADLVRSTLRLRPDRSSSAKCAAPKRWTCSRPGAPDIRAASPPSMRALPKGALLRLEQLILEVAVTPPRALIAEAVNVIVYIAGRGRARRIQTSPRRRLRRAWLPTRGSLSASARFHPLTTPENRHDAHPHFRKSALKRICGLASPSVPRPAVLRRTRSRLQHALGGAAAVDPRLDPGAGGQDHRGDHHHRRRA
jgi:Flp pilus assembly CpaF family ATPase